MSCSLSSSGSCLLSNAIICTQSSWSREARSKGNCFRNRALGLIRGQASNHQLWQGWAALCSTGAHRYMWVHRAYMWCCQVFKSSVKQIPFASSPNMSFFFFLPPSLNLCCELSYFPFLIQELEGSLKPGIKLQEKEWRHLVAASLAHTVRTPKRPFSSAPMSMLQL